MVGALGCATILGANPTSLVSHVGITSFRAPALSVPLQLVIRLYMAPSPRKPRMALCHLPIPPPAPTWHPAPKWRRKTGNARTMSVWTDGSATSNGDERCVTGASWCTENGITTFARLTGMTPNNNIAEVTAVVMALLLWQSTDLHIHTDSKFMLGLVDSGLLAMEHNGWPNLPVTHWAAPASPVALYRHLLCLIHCHNSSLEFSWVKGHSGDPMNEKADALAKRGGRE